MGNSNIKDITKLAEQWCKNSAKQKNEEAKNKLNDLNGKGLKASEDAPKVQDADFGELTHYGKNSWMTSTTEIINNKVIGLLIELEGSENEKVTDAQRKAYAEYQVKKNAFFEAMVAMAKNVFSEACNETNNNVEPTALYIDRQGNYGWKCRTEWNGKTIAVILSDGNVQFDSETVLYNYAKVLACRTNANLKVGDSTFVNVFEDVKVRKSAYKGEVTFIENNTWEVKFKTEIRMGEKKEITDAQKAAYLKFTNNPDHYFNQVKECVFNHYIYNYEDFYSRIIVKQNADNHINNVTEDKLRPYYKYNTLVIDTEGNLGFVLDCTWTEDNEVAVLFSGKGPVALTPEMLRDVKKAEDPDFGFVLHGKYETNKIHTYVGGKIFTSTTKEAGWIGLIPNEFSKKDPYMPVHLECEIDQQITPEQRAAFAEYLKNKEKHYADLQHLAKEVTKDTRGEGDVVVPKVLYIDRDGNYGWLVYVPWNEHLRGVILSDGELYFTKPGIFHNYNTYLKFKAKTEFSMGDTIFFELCKELISVKLSAGGDNAYDENGNHRTDNTLSEEEKDLLNWVLENRNLDQMADDLVEEANYRFNEWTEKNIERIDLLEEMQLSTLLINIDKDGEPEYDVTISGNANWDGMTGVAITSSNREFNGVTGESYVL